MADEIIEAARIAYPTIPLDPDGKGPPVPKEAVLNVFQTIQGQSDATNERVSEVYDELGAFDSRLDTVEAGASGSLIAVATWSQALTRPGSFNGQALEVQETDTGTHSQASATGYDGVTVANAGRYSWNSTWSRWSRIGDQAISLKADKSAVNPRLNAPLTFNRPIIVDRADLIGGGPAVYVPASGTYRNATDGTVFTIALSADPKMSDWSKVAISATTALQRVYYDRVDASVKVAVAGTADIQVDPTRYFHLLDIYGPSNGGGAGITSPYKVLNTADEGASIAAADQRAMVFDRTNYKLRIPTLYGYRFSTATWTLSPVAATDLYREITLPSSGALYHVWLDTNDLVQNGANSPTAVHVTQGFTNTSRVNGVGSGGLILLGTGYNRTFFSACGIDLATIVRNQFGAGKEDNDDAETVISNCDPVALVDATANALGFTRGWHGTVSGDRSVYVGGKFDQPIRTGAIFFRFFVFSPSGSFGTPRALLWGIDTDGSRLYVNTGVSLLKAHSANVREYIGISSVIGTTRYEGMWMGGEFAAIDCIVFGMAFAGVAANNPWISELDYPRNLDVMGRRLRNLESTLGNPDLPLDALIPPDLYLISERRYPVYLPQMVRNPVDGRLRASVAVVPTSNTQLLQPKEVEGGTLDLSSYQDGQSLKVSIHDNGGPNTRNYRRDIALHVKPLSAVAALPPIIIHGIGDSLTNVTGHFVNAVKRMQAMGATVTTIGTRSMSSIVSGDGTLNGEGRSGKQFADFINQKNDLMFVPASTAAYNAATDAAKANLNPYLRAATGDDAPSIVFNGQVFDFAYYLSRFTYSLPSVVWLELMTNDVGFNTSLVAQGQIQNGLRVMVGQIRAAAPNALIVLPFPAYGRTGDNARWTGGQWDALKVFQKFVRDLADPRLMLIPLYAGVSRDIGYETSSAVNADTGMATDSVSDATHNGVIGVMQSAEMAAQSILARLVELA